MNEHALREPNYQERTWNVIVGCSRVSAGCENCYAIPECLRMSRNPKITGKHAVNPYAELIQIKNAESDFSGKLHFFDDRLDTPLKTRKPAVWFVNSLSDMYHEGLPLDTIQRVFEVMNRADWHIFQILTKRAARMAEIARHMHWTANIWQGVTFEGIPAGMPDGQQRALMLRIESLRKHPAAIKFISFEPLIGPIPDLDLSGIHWAFFGGESHGSPQKARPMDLQWLRDGIALCQRFHCEPFIKQLGSNWALGSGNWPPPKGTDRSEYGRWRMGKPRAGAWPDDLQPYAIDSMREINPEKLRQQQDAVTPENFGCEKLTHKTGHVFASDQIQLRGEAMKELETKASLVTRQAIPDDSISDAEGSVSEERAHSWSAEDLIKLYETTPPQPILEDLLFENDTLLIHGSEENYKSVFIVQMGESIACGTPLLRKWKSAGKRRVGIIETEMHAAQLGSRLKVMFPSGNAPANLRFLPEEVLKEWRRRDLKGKFHVIEDWVNRAEIEVLMIDTANDFFRGSDNASEEACVGGFFDQMRNLRLTARILVRHDRKRREKEDSLHSNERIRGSSEWKQDPEAIISLERVDRRTHEVAFEVGKLRYGTKPEPMSLWFDAGAFRLVPLPPVIAVLENGPVARQDVVSECERRFGLAERTVDDMLFGEKGYLRETRNGHKRVFEIDPERSPEAPWHGYLTVTPEGPG